MTNDKRFCLRPMDPNDPKTEKELLDAIVKWVMACKADYGQRDMLFTSSGTLRYEDKKLVVLADQQLSDYYRSMIPKYYRVQPQKYRAHISVVRKETPPDMSLWGKREGERVEFQYQPYLHNDATYWWLNIFCVHLEEVRRELGLPVSSPYTQPPSGFKKCFHLTVGNTKEK
jgi:hypothetical protein